MNLLPVKHRQRVQVLPPVPGLNPRGGAPDILEHTMLPFLLHREEERIDPPCDNPARRFHPDDDDGCAVPGCFGFPGELGGRRKILLMPERLEENPGPSIRGREWV